MLTELSGELVACVLQYLDQVDAVSLTRTCHYLRSVVHAEYKITPRLTDSLTQEKIAIMMQVWRPSSAVVVNCSDEFVVQTYIRLLPEKHHVCDVHFVLRDRNAYAKFDFMSTFPNPEYIQRLSICGYDVGMICGERSQYLYKNLAWLKCDDSAVTLDRILPLINGSGCFRGLYLRDCDYIYRNVWPSLANHATLEELTIIDCKRFTIYDMQEIGQLPALRSLTLKECGSNLDGLRSILSSRSLRALYLIEPDFCIMYGIHNHLPPRLDLQEFVVVSNSLFEKRFASTPFVHVTDGQLTTRYASQFGFQWHDRATLLISSVRSAETILQQSRRSGCLKLGCSEGHVHCF